MDVVIFAVEDHCQSVEGVLIDEGVVIIKDSLPVRLPGVLESFGPFPCC